jgi:hypothetical protein
MGPLAEIVARSNKHVAIADLIRVEIEAAGERALVSRRQSIGRAASVSQILTTYGELSPATPTGSDSDGKANNAADGGIDTSITPSVATRGSRVAHLGGKSSKSLPQIPFKKLRPTASQLGKVCIAVAVVVAVTVVFADADAVLLPVLCCP